MFRLGDEFHDFNELEVKLHDFEQTNSVKLWKRDFRTIAAARKRLDRHLDEKLKYYTNRYCCVHGGQNIDNKKKGLEVHGRFATCTQCN